MFVSKTNALQNQPASLTRQVLMDIFACVWEILLVKTVLRVRNKGHYSVLPVRCVFAYIILIRIKPYHMTMRLGVK